MVTALSLPADAPRGRVSTARRDDVRLDQSVHWPISEPCADLAGGRFGRLNQPIGVPGLDLVAKRGSLTIADRWIPATRRHAAPRQGLRRNIDEASASRLGDNSLLVVITVGRSCQKQR